jgi:hypothetical protein
MKHQHRPLAPSDRAKEDWVRDPLMQGALDRGWREKGERKLARQRRRRAYLRALLAKGWAFLAARKAQE